MSHINAENLNKNLHTAHIVDLYYLWNC